MGRRDGGLEFRDGVAALAVDEDASGLAERVPRTPPRAALPDLGDAVTAFSLCDVSTASDAVEDVVPLDESSDGARDMPLQVARTRACHSSA